LIFLVDLAPPRGPNPQNSKPNFFALSAFFSKKTFKSADYER
jgi:hypothetical protein